MSSGAVHQSVGIGAGVLAGLINYFIFNKLNIFNPINNAYFFLSIPIAMIYSILPDMDIKSKGSVLFYSLILILSAYMFYLKSYYIASIILLFSIIPQLLPHRNFTHSIWFAIIFPMPIYLIFTKFNINYEYFILFYISALSGYISHLIMDI